MGVPFLLVRWKKPDDLAWNDAYTDNTGPKGITIKKGLEAKNNFCELTFSNVKNSWVSETRRIEKNDLLEVYADMNTVPDPVAPGSSLLIQGIVQNYNQTIEWNKKLIKLKCVDYSYLLLHKIWNKPYINSTEPHQSNTIIVDMIKQTSDTKGVANYKILADLVGDGGYVQDDKNDGNPFQNIDYTAYGKTIYAHIQELSTPTKTGDDLPYIFWIGHEVIGGEVKNVFHWEYPDTSTPTDLEEGGDGIISLKPNKSVFDIVNMVIYRAGRDCNDIGITWYYFDPQTDQPDLRMLFEDYSNFADEKREEEWTEAVKGHNKVFTDLENWEQSYPAPAEYPYTFYNFKEITQTGNKLVQTQNTWTVATDAEYNTAIRRICKMIGRMKAQEVIETRATARYKFPIVMKGTNVYTPGDFIRVTSASEAVTNLEVRVHDITHQITKNGWITTLDVQEDEKAITE